MTDGEADALNRELLRLLQDAAPWAADEVRATVIQGRPIAKQVRKGPGRGEIAVPMTERRNLSDSQFGATEELNAQERLDVTLQAMERLLIDPAEMQMEIDRAFTAAFNTSDIKFAEPLPEELAQETTQMPFVGNERRNRVRELIAKLRSEMPDVRKR